MAAPDGAGPVAPGGAVMVSAFRTVPALPLIVAVSLDKAEMLAPWRRELRAFLIGYSIISVALIGLLIALSRQLDANVVSAIDITVADTGADIAPELLPFVFDRFRQGAVGHSKIHGGLGLGLAIVRNLVELHGGTVSACSDGEGRGAKFEVALPAT